MVDIITEATRQRARQRQRTAQERIRQLQRQQRQQQTARAIRGRTRKVVALASLRTFFLGWFL